MEQMLLRKLRCQLTYLVHSNPGCSKSSAFDWSQAKEKKRSKQRREWGRKTADAHPPGCRTLVPTEGCGFWGLGPSEVRRGELGASDLGAGDTGREDVPSGVSISGRQPDRNLAMQRICPSAFLGKSYVLSLDLVSASLH